MKSIIRENSKLPTFIFILYAVQLVIVSFYLLQKEPSLSSWYKIAPIIILGIVLMLFRLKVEFTSTGLKYSFFPFILLPKTIQWSDINTIQIKKADALSNFFGWGVRYSKDYGWGYITNCEYAIYVTKKDKKRLVISIKNKEEVVDFLAKNNISITREN